MSRLGLAWKEAKQVADERGIAITTIRSQIAAILSKIGATRQAELVGLLARLWGGEA
ncbi:helix-turn-helix domain-containing protein [Azospirillum canadense]|uniref:hypothetical protein n=1 Tax=Azospirillum canadense TaxID=403962 RepID=UPI002225DBA8|nr:hypothetical protein [Azospirillum canadense]MCW2239244.1 DNA-binding CsgD family transcriptional regulator [Azospirillum canadense]